MQGFEGIGWLSTWLPGMMEKAPKHLAPQGRSRSYMKVVGVVSEALRPLFRVYLQLEASLTELVREHNTKHELGDLEMCDKVHSEIDWMAQQKEAVMTLFSTALRHEFDCTTKKMVVAEGWAVLTWNEEDDPAYALNQLIGDIVSIVRR